MNKFLGSATGIIDTYNSNVQTTLDTTESDTHPANLVKAMLIGKNTSGTYENVELDQDGHLRVNIADPMSTFGEILVSEPTALTQHVFQYGPLLNGRLWVTTIISGTTMTASIENNMSKVSSGVGPGSSISLESKKRLKYRPGQAIVARFTMLFDTKVAGTTQIIGFGNTVNGFFFGYNGTSFGVLHRVNSVDTWVAQTSWNTDKADGTQTLRNVDWTKLNIAEITIGYLGTANIKMRIYNGNQGHSEFVTVHEFLFAGNRTTPHLTNATLPFYSMVDNGATTTNLIVRCASAMLAIVGKNIQDGFINSVNNTKLNISTTQTNILTIKNNPTHQAITNTTTVYPLQLSVGLVDSKKTNIIRIILNTTLGGTPSYTDVNVNSVMIYDIAGTTITGGTVLGVYILAADTAIQIDLEKLELFLIAGDTLTISSEATAIDTATVSASIIFKEDF